MPPEPDGSERALGSVTLSARFEGPPDSGNGGYVGGLLARAFDAPAALTDGVRTRLLAPPPVEKPLTLVASGDTVELRSEATPLARAVRAPLRLDVPDRVSFDAACEASRAFRGFEFHPIPGCFVCGTEREAGDGMRIFPGRLGNRPGFGEVFAAPWIPDPSLAGTFGDRVDSQFLWAALDCPGCFAFAQPSTIVLLGELTVALEGFVRVGERCVLLSWEIAHEGRKHRTGSALYGEDGSCRGRALGTWIELAPEV